jgi:protease inhibitor Inh
MQRMNVTRSGSVALALTAAVFALAACNTDGLGIGGASTEAPGAPPANMAGRWLFSSPGRGQCHMTFGAAPNAVEGTIAPEGGCPGKFYMSRKWTYDQGGLTVRDHNSQPLAQLSSAGSNFAGKSASGEQVTLIR